MGDGAVATVYTDASSKRGWGAALGGRFIQGKWAKSGRLEGIKWKELWVLRRAMELRGELLAGKLVLVRMGSSTAASYANYGAGRVPHLTMLAREVREREVAIGCTVAALRIAGKDNAVADALSGFSSRVCGLDPRPERELRKKFRSQVKEPWGAVDMDMLASDDGHNAWGPFYRPASNSAFEGPLPRGRQWRFPRIEMVDLVLARIASSMKEDWFGAP